MADSSPEPTQVRAEPSAVPGASSAGCDGWAAMATLPAATSVTKGDKLLIGRLPDTHVVGVASRVSSAADNLGQCGGKRNEGDLGAASQSGWHHCSCAMLRDVIV